MGDTVTTPTPPPFKIDESRIKKYHLQNLTSQLAKIVGAYNAETEREFQNPDNDVSLSAVQLATLNEDDAHSLLVMDTVANMTKDPFVKRIVEFRLASSNAIGKDRRNTKIPEFFKTLKKDIDEREEAEKKQAAEVLDE